MAWIVLAVSNAALYWIYDGYVRFLAVCVAVRRMFVAPISTLPVDAHVESAPCPEMTVLLTVHNEQDVIQQRIANLLECSYPHDRLKVLVASDGSTDQTANLVRAIADDRVSLMETPGLGKTGTQNLALKKVDSDIVVFTDADIVFDSEFLNRIAERFRDARVGAVDGRLLYSKKTGDSTIDSQGFYWNYELKVRHLESQLGWLAVVAGASFAVRRDLLQPMESSIGEDCIVPLDVAQQGFLVVHEPAAMAYNEFEEGAGLTLRRRIRQTLRNWQGTWSRPELLNPIRHPFYALALWSHKLLRWLSPVFLLVALITSSWLLITAPNIFSIAAAVPYLALFGMAGLGWLSTAIGHRIPGTGVALSFLLANTAFLVGIVRATLGSRIHAYRNA